MRIAFAITALNDIPFKIYTNHLQCLVHWSKTYELVLAPSHGTTLLKARDICLEMAKATKCDFILYVDSDVELPLDTLDLLVSHNTDLASGLCMRRSFPFNSIAWMKTGDNKVVELEFDPEVKAVYPVEAVGGGIALFKVSSFDKLEKPYFRHVFVDGFQWYEDVYLCGMMKKAGMDIILDTRVQAGHLCDPPIIRPNNAKIIKEFYEKVNL